MLQTLIDPLWRHGVGRIDTAPPLPDLPVFHPGMGVVLAYCEEIARRVQLAALVTGYHSRRDSRSAQHVGHGAGKVRAETLATVEQEVIDAVCAQDRRFEGVAIRFVAKMLE